MKIERFKILNEVKSGLRKITKPIKTYQIDVKIETLLNVKNCKRHVLVYVNDFGFFESIKLGQPGQLSDEVLTLIENSEPYEPKTIEDYLFLNEDPILSLTKKRNYKKLFLKLAKNFDMEYIDKILKEELEERIHNYYA